MKILVRNLNRNVSEPELLKLFQPYGEVRSHVIVKDSDTGKSKGFGFVEMPSEADAHLAIKELNGKLIQGEKVRVKKTTKQFFS